MTGHDRSTAFRRTAGAFATGVGVVGSSIDDIPVAMTVNSFSTVSLEPTLVLVCLKNRCRLLSWIRQSAVFAMTVLAEDQQSTARWFADARRPSGAAAFAGLRVHRAPVTGCLIFSDGMAYFDCRVRDVSEQGDHAVVVGEAMAFDSLNSWKEPLLYYGGQYRSIETRAVRQVPAPVP